MTDPETRAEIIRTAQYGHKPRFDFGLTFSRSFTSFFGNIGPIILFYILSSLVVWLVMMLIYFVSDQLGSHSGAEDAALNGSAGFCLIASLLLQVAATHSFCIVVAQKKITGQTYKFWDVTRQSLKTMLPLTLIGIVFFIAYYLGFLLLFIPGLIISAGWALLGPAYIFEGVGFWGVFARSWQLTRGYKWMVWLLLLVIELILAAILLVAPVFILPILALDAGQAEVVASSLLAFILTYVMMLFIGVSYLGIHSSAIAAIYVHCRELKEGASNWAAD